LLLQILSPWSQSGIPDPDLRQQAEPFLESIDAIVEKRVATEVLGSLLSEGFITTLRNHEAREAIDHVLLWRTSRLWTGESRDKVNALLSPGIVKPAGQAVVVEVIRYALDHSETQEQTTVKEKHIVGDAEIVNLLWKAATAHEVNKFFRGALLAIREGLLKVHPDLAGTPSWLDDPRHP
jgi:hypothetical protein